MVIEDWKDANGRWVKSTSIDGRSVWAYSYQRWGDMCQRCKVGGSVQKSRPTYIGCTMSPMFSEFQLFTAWHTQQIGYGITGYNLDKDILFSGNKLYSENTCVLVPRELNMFLTASDSSRGLYPLGVCWNKRDQQFQANLNINGRHKFLGYYTSVEAASSAYKAAKESEAKRWYQRLASEEFIVDSRVIERMKNWRLV